MILTSLRLTNYCLYCNYHRKAAATACPAYRTGRLPAKAGIIKRFEFAARAHHRNSTYQLWTHENGAVELFTLAFTQQKLDNIHNNPVRAGIVEKGEDYLYSSAGKYAALRNVLKIDYL